jgi:hypothetical protein
MESPKPATDNRFNMWVDHDVPNWFLTSKNFYQSPFSKWPPQYCKKSTLFDFKGFRYQESFRDIIIYPHMKCRWNPTMLNLYGKFRTGQGKPGELLISVAKEENATMIITGSRGLGKIRRTILGSVSDYVIHHSHIPVLVCNPMKYTCAYQILQNFNEW